MDIRFGMGLLTQTSTATLATIAQKAEQLGFHSVWLSDHYALRNALVGLTHIALQTNSIKIGLGATNPYLVNPVVLASFFRTLNETNNGRSILGIGAGDINMLDELNIKQENPIGTIREYIQILKNLWAGKTGHHPGHIFQMPKAALHFKIEYPPPIYVAAQGPRMVQLAAEIANGVLINAAHPIDYRIAKTQLDTGFTNSGMPRDSFDVAAYAILALSDSSTPRRATRKHIVASIIASAPESILARHNIAPSAADKITRLVKQSKWTELASEITPQMLDSFAIVGTSEDCISRIEELIQTGVTHLVLAPSMKHTPMRTLENVYNKIVSPFIDI